MAFFQDILGKLAPEN